MLSDPDAIGQIGPRWDADDVFVAIRAAHRALRGVPRRGEEGLDRDAWHIRQRADRRFRTLQMRAVSAFAAEHNWRRSSWFALPRLADPRAATSWWPAMDVGRTFAALAFDHAQFFRKASGAPAGVLVHVYDQLRDPQHHVAQALAAKHGLKCEPLAWSWYFPDTKVCTALLYRRYEAGEQRDLPSVQLLRFGP
jgi:hypothetical protein